LPTSQTVALGIIVTELVLNGMKHGVGDGHGAQVRVSLGKSEDDMLHLAVENNDDGLAADFDLTQSSGIGLQLVRALTAQLHGSLRPVLSAGQTRFEVTFPYHGGSP
jgi:two-component system, sensor histidine kinase PdtaS